TVHLIGIDTVFQEDSHYAMMKFDDHFFVGADNGIFSIILGENDPQELYEIDIMQDLRYLHFPLADILSKAACHIAKVEPLSEIGQPIDKPLKKVLVQPLVGPSTIKRHVSYIDAFGNVIRNISKELFNEVQKGRSFKLHFKRNETKIGRAS